MMKGFLRSLTLANVVGCVAINLGLAGLDLQWWQPVAITMGVMMIADIYGGIR